MWTTSATLSGWAEKSKDRVREGEREQRHKDIYTETREWLIETETGWLAEGKRAGERERERLSRQSRAVEGGEGEGSGWQGEIDTDARR